MIDVHAVAREERSLAFEPHEVQLYRLKNQGFDPKVIYDIGSCVLHWTRSAKKIFPDAKYILFDAWEPAEELYTGYEYHIGVLGDRERDVTFYQNDDMPYGNSYYREIGTSIFPESTGRTKRMSSLDKIVKERGFPKPDLIKIDVQGAERDIIRGALETIKNTPYMIVEMQHSNYNKDAPHYDETGAWLESMGWTCIAWRFARGSMNDVDADYLYCRR
jgi:FkbM family methyltransferase